MARPLMAQRVATPPNIEEQISAIHIECYRIGNCAAIVTRENVADARNTPNFRWHLQLAHPERAPTWDEIKIGRTLLPDDIHVAFPFPHTGFAPKEGNELHLWEVHDDDLTGRWEYDSVLHREQSGEESPQD